MERELREIGLGLGESSPLIDIPPDHLGFGGACIICVLHRVDWGVPKRRRERPVGLGAKGFWPKEADSLMPSMETRIPESERKKRKSKFAQLLGKH